MRVCVGGTQTGNNVAPRRRDDGANPNRLGVASTKPRYDARVMMPHTMTALGIALIVIGLALVCAGFIFWPRASRTEAEEKTPRTAEEEKTETGGLADLVQRLNESRDEDPLK